MIASDETLDPARVSWVQSAAPGSDYPIQNLPLGIFSEAKGRRRPGVAIGDYVLDLPAIADLLDEDWREDFSQPVLNAWLSRGADAARELRLRLSEILGRALPRRRRVSPDRSERGAAARAVPRRRLHRFLRRHPPRDQRRQAVPARQSAAAELQICADRLSWPRVVDRRVAAAGAPAARAAQVAGARDARVRAAAGASITSSSSGSGRPRQRARRSRCPSAKRASNRRLLPAQRLVGARHPGVGIPAARAVPRQEFRDHALAVGGDAWRRWRRSARRPRAAAGRPAAAALSRRSRRTATSGGSTSSWKCSLSTERDARGGHAAAAPRAVSDAAMLLDAAQIVAHHTSNGCNLQPGDLIGTRHAFGPTATRARLASRDQPRRQAARAASQRRNAHASSRTATKSSSAPGARPKALSGSVWANASAGLSQPPRPDARLNEAGAA